MRIDAYNQISQIYQTTERRTVGKKNSVYGSDKVEISQFGKDYRNNIILINRRKNKWQA